MSAREVSVIRRKKLWILVLLGVVSLYPFESTVVPSQNILVVSEDWRPIQGAAVRQSWQQYSLESRGHEQDLRTDQNGRVTFPRRTIRASVLMRIVHPISNILTQGIHASFGTHTETLPLGDVIQAPLGQEPVKAQLGDIVFRLR